jgi:hypothetical protein
LLVGQHGEDWQECGSVLGKGSDVAFGSGERDRLLEVCGGGIAAAGGVRRESF